MRRRIILVMILFFSLYMTGAQNSFSPAKEALRLFNIYKPVIEKNNGAIVDEPKIITGDVNNDSLEDCIIFFVMSPKTGGNAIIGQEAAIYINTGKGMKVTGAFPKFDFCYTVDKISDQVIYLNEYKCQPPYNEFVRVGDSSVGATCFIFYVIILIDNGTWPHSVGVPCL